VTPLPGHVSTAVDLVTSYLTDPSLQEHPFLALGEYGLGRGHYLADTIRRNGFVPRWLYEPVALPASDLDGNALFPVYDVPKAQIRNLPAPSIVLVPSSFDRKSATYRGWLWAPFGRPESWNITDVLAARGLPVEAAEGNPAYGPAIRAAEVLQMTGVLLTSEPPKSRTWSEFRNGGSPPVEDGLLPYYLAYTFPTTDSSFNRGLWIRSRLARESFGECILDAIRNRIPTTELRFPRVLSYQKPKPREEPETKTDVASAAVLTKSYAIDWG